MALNFREVQMMKDKESLVEEIFVLTLALKKAKDDLEHEQVRLAGCGVAALGYSASNGKDLKPGDYGYSASYGDVLRLRDSYERISLIVEQLIVTETRNNCSVEESLTHKHIIERVAGRLIAWLRAQPSAPSIAKKDYTDRLIEEVHDP